MQFLKRWISRPSAKFVDRPSIRGGACIAVAILAPALAWLALASPDAVRESLRPSVVDGDFRLRSNSGEIVDSRAMRGRPYAVFFGFTRCPGVCATTMLEMSSLLREVGREAAELKVFFITLDPERDTAETLANFLSSFGPEIVGLTGTGEEIAGAVKSFRVYYRKALTEHGDYTIDHSTLVYLVDRKGRVVDFLSFDQRHDIALEKLKRLILEDSRAALRSARDRSVEAHAF
ncbi:MAG: SCO family protein [Methylocystis sp.]